jgi:alkylation response protein AidB-like acyl-CoA dehydrogenase
MRPNLQSIFQSSFQNEKGEYANVLTKKEIQLLFDHQLLKCFLPKSIGGLELTILDTLKVIEEASFINGSLGWLIQIGNGGNYFLTNFEKQKANEIFSPSDAVIAGSGTPTSVATKTEGGYLISGKWRFCSGSDYATLFTITFKIEGTEEVVSAVVKRKDVTIINDWKTIGLKNTSTNTIELMNVFIPEDTLFTVMKRKSYFDDPIYDLPFLVYAQAFFLQVVYGTFRKMIASYSSQIENEVLYQERHVEKYQKVKKMLLVAEELLIASKNELEEIILMLLDKKEINLIEKQQCLIDQAYKIKNTANQLFTERGIEALYESNPFSIAYLDLLAVSQHKLLNELV